ncbi:MAG: hypothetical protein EOO39_11010 [Cytophagaceae bacterium]|nr:MAG: hypothetical protein EOO39_11010 [Cytophagaceae bacterium]
MYSFDKNGCLTPYSGTHSDIESIYDQLVADFPASSSRGPLYHEWTKYNRLLRQVVGENFSQWINGSFVTKKRNPKDIDLVSFIPYQAYERNEEVLDKFWSDTWEAEGIDAYLVKVYPIDHDSYMYRTLPEARQWFNRYTATKAGADFVSYPKGFLSIIVV